MPRREELGGRKCSRIRYIWRIKSRAPHPLSCPPNPLRKRLKFELTRSSNTAAGRDLNKMSGTAITSKFKLRWFPNEGPYKAGKLKTDIDLGLLMPDEDKFFSGSSIWICEFDDVTHSIRNHPYFSFACLLGRVFPVRFKSHDLKFEKFLL